MIFQTLAPDIEIITPIRDKKLSRQEEILFLKDHGVDMQWAKAKYSINRGLWGTSVGGEETLTSNLPLPEEAYPSQLQEKQERQLKLTFERGELVAIDGQKGIPVENIERLSTIASAYAIGRDIHVGDTIIGIKGRVGFEAAAPLIIIKAHHLLEKHTLTKCSSTTRKVWGTGTACSSTKASISMRSCATSKLFWKMRSAMSAGDVFVTLHPYRFTLDGVLSDHDLMNASFASYGETNEGWTASDAKGFIKITSNQGKIFNHVNQGS